MTNSRSNRAALAQAAFELTPPLIRRSLLEQAAFREEYDVSTDPLLTFQESGFTVQRSDLFGAVREVLAGLPKIEVSDANGREWQIRNEGEDEKPSLTASLREDRQSLPDFLVLSPKRETRQSYLSEKAFDVNLPSSDRARWEGLLDERPLRDEEVETLLGELRDTPVHFQRSVGDWPEGRTLDARSLVPHSKRYFERLVGVYDGSKSILDYASRPGKALLNNLTTWRPLQGFLDSLLLSGHPAFTAQIGISGLSSEEFIEAYEFLEEFGGPVSKLGAIEVGMRNLGERREIEPFLVRFIEGVRDDDVNGAHSECEAFTSLFVLVDGQLSSSRLLSEAPPFYRRLAAFAQAELVWRKLVQGGADVHHFARWAMSIRGVEHYMQSFCDMQIEPRWNPNLATAGQLKENILGRIIIAGDRCRQHIGEGALRSLVLGSQPGSLGVLAHFPLLAIPSPLEGCESQSEPLPEDAVQRVREELDEPEPSPSTFFALLNCAMLFKTNVDLAEQAARVLNSWSNGFPGLEGRSQLLDILYGLANVAASARNCPLANEIRTCIRTCRRDKQIEISVQEATGILLTVSASRSEPADWREFVGECMVEFAFGELKVDEAEYLHSCLRSLLHAVPDLWHSCSNAEAALKALIGSKP